MLGRGRHSGTSAARSRTRPIHNEADARPGATDGLRSSNHSPELTQAILDNVADGVYVADRNGKIRLWSAGAETVTGRTAGKTVGRSCNALGLCVGDRPLDCSNGCALLELLRDAPGSSVEVKRRTGRREQELLVRVRAVGATPGTDVEVVHSVRNITTLKQADEAKAMFLATASHELKTPLTVILGYTQALREGWMDEEQDAEALSSIESRALQLSRIVDRLLLTGRIQSGRISLSLEEVAVDELLRERIDTLARATSRRISYQRASEPLFAVADTDALATAIEHLLDNAMKYSPKDTEVEVMLRERSGRVLIEVIDSGIGMTPEEAARCFERFWQAESSDVRRFGGTGVGLYIVRSLVEGMGGTIGVASTPGEGTTFNVILNRATPEKLRELVGPSVEPGQGKRSMIQEFMRQIGVPGGGGT